MMESLKKIFFSIVNAIKSVVLFILDHTFFQILIILFFLYMFQTQLFKHSKFGVFINCSDNTIHDNRTEQIKK